MGVGGAVAPRELPGELEKIRVWFRDYKKPDGARPPPPPSFSLSTCFIMTRQSHLVNSSATLPPRAYMGMPVWGPYVGITATAAEPRGHDSCTR